MVPFYHIYATSLPYQRGLNNRRNLNAAAFAHAGKRGLLAVFLPLQLWRLPKTYAWSATILVDELDARRTPRWL